LVTAFTLTKPLGTSLSLVTGCMIDRPVLPVFPGSLHAKPLEELKNRLEIHTA
jgi:hypothetical protein